VASWAGLEDEQGASPDGHIVQAGTDALCSGSSCSPTYDEWYEYGSTRTTCSGSIQAGDTISAEVYNDVISGGYNYQYGFTVSDSRSGLYCHADLLSYNSMLSPTYGMFITENEEYCTGTACASLAEFGTVHFYDAEIYTSSQYQYIYTFSSKGYDYQDVMQNAPISRFGCGPTYTTNASPGAISSPGTFYVHWKSSQNTPVWGNDNC